jgi:hypothetical protein
MREEYGELKLALAKEEHADIGAYGAKKQAFIIRALEQSGLSKEEMDRIMLRPHRRVDAKIVHDRKRTWDIWLNDPFVLLELDVTMNHTTPIVLDQSSQPYMFRLQKPSMQPKIA